MKRVLVFLAAFFVGGWASLSADTRAEELRAELLNPASDHVFVAAHRADWRNYPENSMEAMESALKMGVDILEIDLQLTADSVLIIMHDRTLDRTTTGHGPVSACNWSDIQQLYLRSGHGEPSRYRVPSLRDVLLRFQGRVLINLDKADRYFDLVMPLLEETGTARQVIMKGSRSVKEVNRLFGKYLDKVIYMPVVNLKKESDLSKIDAFRRDLHPCAYELCFPTDTMLARRAAKMVQGESLVWVNTLWPSLCAGLDDDSHRHRDSSYGFLIDTMHVRIIQTDRPQELINYIKQRNPQQLFRDWAQYSRYTAHNDSIVRGLLPRPDVVLMGNSITQHWVTKRPAFFSEHNFLGRGISGQSSAQMLARFQADVIDLKPHTVVILAGTNDVACNNGYISNEHIVQQIISMCQLAQANDIRPVLCAIPPSERFYWRPAVGNPTERIKQINRQLRDYASHNNLLFVDYYAPLADEHEALRSDFTADGVHPNVAGYEVMESVLLQVLKQSSNVKPTHCRKK